MKSSTTPAWKKIASTRWMRLTDNAPKSGGDIAALTVTAGKASTLDTAAEVIQLIPRGSQFVIDEVRYLRTW